MHDSQRRAYNPSELKLVSMDITWRASMVSNYRFAVCSFKLRAALRLQAYKKNNVNIFYLRYQVGTVHPAVSISRSARDLQKVNTE